MHMPLEDSLGLNLLAANQHQASPNREHFDAWNLLCLNVMSSPGAGKTSLLERTLAQLSSTYAMAVLEGDMTTQLDAERLEAVGIPVVPITTGRSCHLDAAMVSGGLRMLRQRLDPASLDLLWVENVGNLVCPAEFEVGEHRKVALLSVTEGEDKPLKYPVMFREADCVLITKTDLLPYLPVARSGSRSTSVRSTPAARCCGYRPATARAWSAGTSGWAIRWPFSAASPRRPHASWPSPDGPVGASRSRLSPRTAP